LDTGELLLVPPAVRFGITDGGKADGRIVAVPTGVARAVSNNSELLRMALESDQPIWLSGRDPRHIGACIEALWTAVGQVTASSNLAVHAALYSLFYALATTLLARGIDASASGDQATRVATAFVDLIERHYRSQRPLTAYCDELLITERALRRATHRVYGQTPLQMVHMRTIVEAKRLLRYTHVSVADVGAALGFEDPAYFNRFFKKSVGKSPRAWRVRQIGM
ncbi:MAG: helix-turn-helix domain-containing protein, partial [Pseudomonadota bacterium]